MGLFSAFLEKTFFYPLNHQRRGDARTVYVQARGDGLYPLIKDGDILHIEEGIPSSLHAGDLAFLQRPGGQFAVQRVPKEGNLVNGDEGQFRPDKLVGRIAAIEQDGRTKSCDNRLARIAHSIYFSARPAIKIILIGRKMLSLFYPRFFVRDPESSLRFVAQKFNDAEEVLHYSRHISEGLDQQEQVLIDQFMGRGGRILNIGCGPGREAFGLAELGFDVVGIDVAPRMIAEAKRHAHTLQKNIEFEVKCATALDYPSKSFDYVLMSAGVYSHIPTRQLRIETLRRIDHLLTSNGILFFSVLYRSGTFFSRISLYDMLRMIAKPILKERLHSEPGDMLVRYVSPVGTPSKLCYVHFFRENSEVLEEINLAGLEGFEDKRSGYWVVKSCIKGGEHDCGQFSQVCENILREETE